MYLEDLTEHRSTVLVLKINFSILSKKKKVTNIRLKRKIRIKPIKLAQNQRGYYYPTLYNFHGTFECLNTKSNNKGNKGTKSKYYIKEIQYTI